MAKEEQMPTRKQRKKYRRLPKEPVQIWAPKDLKEVLRLQLERGARRAGKRLATFVDQMGLIDRLIENLEILDVEIDDLGIKDARPSLARVRRALAPLMAEWRPHGITLRCKRGATGYPSCSFKAKPPRK